MRDVIFDHHRASRIGLPEAVFCEGKSAEAVHRLLTEFADPDAQPVLFTRLERAVLDALPDEPASRIDYHPLSRTAWRATMPARKGRVAVVSAGTADGHATWEAARTLTFLGIENHVYEDCGVAGLWRLIDRLPEINEADVVIVVAGLDAALASVLGALTPKPVFAVPTSVGYGMSQGGVAAIQSMLVSCAPGVAVLNVDNGYGAACAAARVLRIE